MTIVRCPRCRDEVTVPARATGRALVRCPLCLEEYLLAEALANAPPPLVVIGGEVEQAAIPGSSESDEYRLAGVPLSAAALAASAATATPSAAALTPRPVLRSAPRHRRSESGGGLLLLINYVVGGVLGLSMGLMVLWWGFRQDPLLLGPPVARYVPLIVPQQFRGKPANGGAVSSARPGAPSAVAPSPSSLAENERSRDGFDSTSSAAPKKSARKKSAHQTSAKEPAAELQTLPGFDEPAKLPRPSLTPTIEAPSLNNDSAAVVPGSDLLQQLPRPASAVREFPAAESKPSSAPPMPDLTDLLPDGP